MKNKKKSKKGYSNELFNQVIGKQYIKTVKSSFYKSDHYVAICFYKPIANC